MSFTQRVQNWRAQVVSESGWVSEGVSYLRTGIVNVCFIEVMASGDPPSEERSWCLVDAGLANYTSSILSAADRLFGGRPPQCILLTHGHFDHVGCLRELADFWQVPIYAHRLELPYLTGRSSYPPPDPTVGGGLFASLSWAFPKKPIDLGDRIQSLPSDHSVPGLADWQWVHTPGHTPGHVSFFRQRDKTLIAGDAFTTVKQESLLAVLAQRKEIHGPPAYFTSDWILARKSIIALADLDAETAITGHGQPLSGAELREGLRNLAIRFEEKALPVHGRYALEPATADDEGVKSLPPDVPHSGAAFLAGVASGILVASLLLRRST